MAENAYFELVIEDDKTYLQVHPPDVGGEMFDVDEVVRYLTAIGFPDFDLAILGNYMKKEDYTKPLLLLREGILPKKERCMVSFQANGTWALARFYPPSTNGEMLTEDDIIEELQDSGVQHGIKRKAIQHFLTNHEYCRDYIIAEATPPIQGRNARIKYFFDINATAKPKLREDGSVDFHQLGNIKVVNEGDKLAELTPADRGRPGISVMGTPLNPRKVRNRQLRFGRNIRLSKDKCTIYSEVSGHVTLVDDMVMVSDIYQVPANVDSSTGDIVYKGAVEVAGNVTTGFRVEAESDIVVNGVVEGATLISGGNIVLKRGMQGAGRGELQAEGNITAKFLENCTVKCKGELKADAVLHSKVECGENIDVLGKKGLINGGSVRTYAQIHATTLGSTMGSSTIVEVISDVDLVKRANHLRDRIDTMQDDIKAIDRAADTVRDMVESKQEVPPEQMQYIRQAAARKPALAREMHNLRYEREELVARIQKNKNAGIRVEGTVYSGVKIMIKDVVKNVNEKLQHCRFVREGADVRSGGF